MSRTILDFSVEGLHPLTQKLLIQRGVVGNEATYDFLFPSYEKHIGDPFLIHGMRDAVDRILEAMKQGEKIAVYSDYDCDGIPGGVLLRTFFDDIGYPVEMYIPHRHNEGYGVHMHAIDALKEKGVSLVITVDSGIANIDEVAYAKSIGVDFIVTDHHLPVTQESSKQIAKGKKGGKDKKTVVRCNIHSLHKFFHQALVLQHLLKHKMVDICIHKLYPLKPVYLKPANIFASNCMYLEMRR